MKILFIFPSVGRKPNEPYVASWKMEPLSFAVLAALTPPEHEVAFYDDRLEDLPLLQPADLVVMSVETYTARRAYAIALRFRERGIPVILGGFHPTLLPEEALEHADAVIIGDGEDTWPQALEDAGKKSLRRRYISGRPAMNGLIPDRRIFKGKTYLPVSLVESARGCSYDCGFCSVTRFFERSYRARPVESVVRELKGLGPKSVFFIDDNIAMDAARAKALFRALIPLKITWFSQGSIHMAQDEELLSLMKQSGCLGVLIGFESLSEENLRQMNKPVRDGQSGYARAIRRLREYGILVYGTFVFGYDGDDEKAFERTLDFAIEQKFFLAAFNHLVPFPGTPLYRQLKEEGRLLYEKWWLEPGYRFGDVAFHPEKMTAQRLSELCIETRRKFYSSGSIIQRFCDHKTHARDMATMWQYWTINLFSRSGVEGRQGLPLGEEA